MNKVILAISILALTTVVYSAPTKHQHNGRTHTHQYPVSGANHKHGVAKPETANIKPKNVGNSTVPSIPLNGYTGMMLYAT